jgi:hypothetical protein
MRTTAANGTLWWHACRVHEGKFSQPTRLPLQNRSGKEHA